MSLNPSSSQVTAFPDFATVASMEMFLLGCLACSCFSLHEKPLIKRMQMPQRCEREPLDTHLKRALQSAIFPSIRQASNSDLLDLA